MDWGADDEVAQSAGTTRPPPDRRTPSVAAIASKGATDVSAIERRRLFEPTPGKRRAEAAGRIYIYEGLRDTDVERALKEELNRVQNMMFIRVKPTNQDGNPQKDPTTGVEYVQNDGC